MTKSYRSLIMVVALALVPTPVGAQEPVYWDVIDRIRSEGFENSQVMDNAGYLADVIGPRLTGSPNMRQAQEWAMDRMTDFALSRVEKEPWGDETAVRNRDHGLFSSSGGDFMEILSEPDHGRCSRVPTPVGAQEPVYWDVIDRRRDSRTRRLWTPATWPM